MSSRTDLAAREAADGDDHLVGGRSMSPLSGLNVVASVSWGRVKCARRRLLVAVMSSRRRQRLLVKDRLGLFKKDGLGSQKNCGPGVLHPYLIRTGWQGTWANHPSTMLRWGLNFRGDLQSATECKATFFSGRMLLAARRRGTASIHAHQQPDPAAQSLGSSD